jgi:rare lipoprotein A
MKTATIHAALLLAAASMAGCERASAQCGIASAYTEENGVHAEPSNQMNISAAHQSLPLGTRLVVRNQRTGRSIIVRIADRSPVPAGHIIDLSAGAMNALGLDALAPVCLEVVSYGSERRGYGRIAVRNPLAEVKHASVRQHHHTARAARPAQVHGRNKSAAVHASKRKRYAQVHR